MPTKTRKTTTTTRSPSTSTTRGGTRPAVIAKESPDPSASSSGGKSPQVKTKRPVPTASSSVTTTTTTTAPAPARSTLGQRWDRNLLAANARQSAATKQSFASSFASAISVISQGVTIGIDKNLDVSVIRNASTRKANASGTGHPHNTPQVADGLDDPRLLDLEETANRFMAASAAAGSDGPARARFAAVMLGVRAANATQIEQVADAALEDLRARLRGENPRNKTIPLSARQVLAKAATTWKRTTEAEFWQAMTIAAQRPQHTPPDEHLREQAAWLGIVAELGKPAVTPPWTWNSAAEKADLVDALITAGTGAPDPAAAIMQRVGTLTRGPDKLPRAIAAELAQIALAALPGVAKAPAPADRRAAIRFKERPAPNATAQELTAHQAREALRSTAQDLVPLDAEGPDPFETRLFRAKLSRLYVDAREQLRHHVSAEISGPERYARLLDILGPIDKALVDTLDRWSAAIASGSVDVAQYVDLAREVRAAIEAYAGQLESVPDPNDPEPDPAKKDRLFRPLGPEMKTVFAAVQMLGNEVGLEAGEVLLGQVAPPGDPLGGLRHQLTRMREDQRLLRDARYTTGEPRPLMNAAPFMALGDALKGAPLNALNAAAAQFDAESPKQPTDPGALGAAVDALLQAGQQAVAATNTMGEAHKRAVVQAVDLARMIAAERVEREQGPLAAKAVALRAGIPTLPLPAIGTALDRFWSNQKDAALALVPSAVAKQVRDAMNLDLGTELGKLSRLAAAGDVGTEEQAWRVTRILRAYKATAGRLPATQTDAKAQADAKAKLQSALDGLVLSVERLLPAPPAVGG